MGGTGRGDGQGAPPGWAAHLETLEAERTKIEDAFAETMRDEQLRWFEDRDLEEYMTDDTCCREFFVESKESQTLSHIEHTRDKEGHRVKSMGRIQGGVRKHFCGDGSIFYLHAPTPRKRGKADRHSSTQ